MPWPLYIIIVIIPIFLAVSLLPDFLLNPKGYYQKIRQKRNIVKTAKKKKTICIAYASRASVPSMVADYGGYNIFGPFGTVLLQFKDDCLFLFTLFFGKFVLFYNEIAKVSVERAKFHLLSPMKITFCNKEKKRTSLVLNIKMNEKLIDDIEKIIELPVERLL